MPKTKKTEEQAATTTEKTGTKPGKAPRGNGQATPGKSPVGAGRKGKGAVAEGPVVYDKLEATWLLGDDAMTGAKARDLLGWEEEPEKGKWGEDEYLFKDEYDRKVRCLRNAQNREFHKEHASSLAYDILNRHWADSRNSGSGEDVTHNGESIIIGRHGNVLSAQHRLVGLVLAEQLWHLQPAHWRDTGLWPDGPPTMEALLVTGVSEGPRTTRTLDNVMPRGLNDVLFADKELFGRYKAGDRGKLTKLVDLCVRTLWDRTGAGEDTWSPYRTHSEALEFIRRHEKLKRCVKHVFDINKRSKNSDGELLPDPVGRYVGPGTAAALCYLMACSFTKNPDEKYWSGEARLRSEKKLDFSAMETATQFFSDLASGKYDKDLRDVFARISALDAEVELSPVHKVATVCKLWPYVRDGEPYSLEQIIPDVRPNAAQKWVVSELITVGGIDQGRSQDRQAEVRRQKAGKGKETGGGTDTIDEEVEGSAEDGEVQEVEEGHGSPASLSGGRVAGEPEMVPNYCVACRNMEVKLYGALVNECGHSHDVAVEQAGCKHKPDRKATDPSPEDPTPDEIARATEEARQRREEQRDKLMEDRKRRLRGEKSGKSRKTRAPRQGEQTRGEDALLDEIAAVMDEE